MAAVDPRIQHNNTADYVRIIDNGAKLEDGEMRRHQIAADRDQWTTDDTQFPHG